MNTPSDQDALLTELNHLPGPVVLEFGSSSCPHCLAFRPIFEELLKEFPAVRHIRIEDGPGKPLGRSFHVKLWPTLVFLLDGEMLHREARPDGAAARKGLAAIAS